MLRQILSDRFWRNNATFLVGSVTVSAVNYFYHLIMARAMDLQSFGELQLVITISNQFGILLGAFNIVIIIAANQKAKNKVLSEELQNLGRLFALAALISLIIAAPFLTNIFDFQSAWPFILLPISLVLIVMATMQRGFLQTHKRFFDISVAGMIAAITRIVASLSLVLLGFSTTGAVGGIVISAAALFWFMNLRARQLGASDMLLFRRFELARMRSIMPLVLATVASVALATYFMSIDVILAKRLLDADSAGLYAGISSISKIILIGTASVSGVMIASIGPKLKESINRQVLFRSVGLTLVLGGGALTVFALFDELVTKLMLGSDFESVSHLLPRLGISALAIALMYLLTIYLLAFKRYGVVPLLGLCVAISIVIFAGAADTMEQLASSLMQSSLIALVLLIGLTLYYYSKRRLF